MASLNSIEQTNLTANSDIESMSTTTKSVLESIDTAGGGKFSHAKYDFTGININGKSNMDLAITTYCNNVNKKIDELVTTGTTAGTFTGEYTAAIDEFLVAIKSSCQATVNGMLKFKKDLDSVVAAMQAKDKNLAQNVSDDASSISSLASNSESN